MDLEMSSNNIYKLIPKVDVLLEDSNIQKLIDEFGRDVVVDVIRECIDDLREFVKQNKNATDIKNKTKCLPKEIKDRLISKHQLSVKKVINGTGTILHTNLGRAPLSQKHLDKVNKIMSGYTNLEYDLQKGERGLRYSHIEDKIKYITGAESAIVVNNNASAVMLVLSSLAKGKEAITSRGELVEIGGSFRIPDVMEASGAKLVDVGTTNKTHISDYENAITSDTALFLKVHTSNYKIVGFAESVSLTEMCNLGAQNNIPVYQDLGSGVLIDLAKYGLEHEPTVQESVKAGVDVISFSGDKLLGGPQAGIIVGKKQYIDKIKKNPVTRALRVDKFTISMLDAVLCEYFKEQNAIKNIPILKNLTGDVKELKNNAENLAKLFANLKLNFKVKVIETKAQAGGGSMPTLEIDSFGIEISHNKLSVSQLEELLRNSEVPIIGRVSHDKFILDVRTLDVADFQTIVRQFESIG